MSTRTALVAAAPVPVLAGPALAREKMTTIAILISAVLMIGASNGIAFAREHHARHRVHSPVASHVLARPMPASGIGQYPAPDALAAQSALPACGFAAVESWGENGFQYCDGRNRRPADDFPIVGHP